MNPKSADIIKINSISEEIEGAYELILEGIRQINNPRLFHLNNSVPLHLLSFGFERLLKTLILMYRTDEEKQFPTHKRPKDAFEGSHNLTVLIDELITYMEKEPFIVDYPYTQNELSALRENQRFRDFISILEDYGQFQRFHHIDTLVTETPTFSEDKNPYLRFKRFHWSFLPEGNIDPTLEEKVEAQKLFSFLVMDLIRILCRNFYNGMGTKFRGQAHGFSNFTMKDNEDLSHELTRDKGI